MIKLKKLKDMFIHGAAQVAANYEYIDELNVFPVPDGDTGTNLKITLMGAADSIKDSEFKDLFELGKRFSRGLLMNARGNSGVIFSQIIKGFSTPFKEGQTSLSIADIISCIRSAKEKAYKSVINPVEGTILTVIRVVSEKLDENIGTFKNPEACFEFIVNQAWDILQQTPEFLPELKTVGVVDSGGYGLCCFLTGMYEQLCSDDAIIETKNVTQQMTIKNATNTNSFLSKQQQSNSIVDTYNNDGFGYCNEFIMKIGSKVSYLQEDKKPFDLEQLKGELMEIGDSIVAVNEDDIVKVHVHSTEPYKVLEIGAKYGEFVKVKIENMTLQFLQRNPGTTLEQLTEQEKRHLKLSNAPAIVATVPSGKFQEIYANDFKVKNTINTEFSGNPSIQEFLDQIRNTRSKNVIIVTDDSNVILAAQQAIELMKNTTTIEILPCKNILQSYLCLLHFDPMLTTKNNLNIMNRCLKKMLVGAISTSVKNIKYDRLTVNKDDYIGIVDKKILFADKNIENTIEKLIEHLAIKTKRNKKRMAYVVVGKDAQVKTTTLIEKILIEKYNIKTTIIVGEQPTYNYYIGVA